MQWAFCAGHTPAKLAQPCLHNRILHLHSVIIVTVTLSSVREEPFNHATYVLGAATAEITQILTRAESSTSEPLLRWKSVLLLDESLCVNTFVFSHPHTHTNHITHDQLICIHLYIDRSVLSVLMSWGEGYAFQTFGEHSFQRDTQILCSQWAYAWFQVYRITKRIFLFIMEELVHLRRSFRWSMT